MENEQETLPHGLPAVLGGRGLTWEALREEASEIVLFGSRALAVQDASSDWDLLCVGGGTSLRTAELDVIWIAPDKLWTPEWLGSELAVHVARYGKWICGESRWSSAVYVSAAAILRKREMVSARFLALEKAWAALGPENRRRVLTKVRLDLQRLVLLEQGHPVPPRQLLDREWLARPDVAWWLERAQLLGMGEKLQDLISRGSAYR